MFARLSALQLGPFGIFFSLLWMFCACAVNVVYCNRNLVFVLVVNSCYPVRDHVGRKL